MAAAQNLSPGGALLRASRLFAVPAPLPAPNSFSGFGGGAGTLPHPTHLSITTMRSSLKIGDWGLKRSLPLRSTTKTSTPLVRVTTMDTFEHVTEFESAADHTLTLKKWQELHVALSTPKKKTSYIEASAKDMQVKSVFEEDIDYTAPRELKPNQDSIRWNYNGPWLAGQTESEFNDYLKKEVRRRKPAFHRFLREEYVRNHNSKLREKARGDEDIPEEITLSSVTEDQFNVYLKELRSDHTTLFRLIRDFLDLSPAPPVKIDDRVLHTATRTQDQTQLFANAFTGAAADNATPEPVNPYATSGPPKTHPSAGLSYLRSMSYINNHPIFGPQEDPTPVKSRVIMPRGAAVGTVSSKLGVAGIVVDTPVGAGGFDLGNIQRKGQFSRPEDRPTGLQYIDPEKYGGSKMWLRIQGAHLDPEGRPSLWSKKASEMSVLVAEGKVKNVEEARVPFSNRMRLPPNRSAGENRGYGLSGGSRRPETVRDGQELLRGFLNSSRDEDR